MKIFKNLFFSTMSILLFQNCSPKSFQASTDNPSANLKNQTEGNTPQIAGDNLINPETAFGPGAGTTNLTPEEIQKLCPSLNSIDHVGKASLQATSNAPTPIDQWMISGAGSAIQILGNIRSLTIDSFAGEIVAKAENLVRLSSFAGQARIAAQQSGPITSFAGEICLSTNSVGNITSGAGQLHIIGPKTGMGQGGDVSNRAGETYISDIKLGQISDMAGQLTVVGGSIQSLSKGAGQVILDHVEVDTIHGDTFSGVIILKNGTTVKHAFGGNIIQN